MKLTSHDVATLVHRQVESGEFDNWHGITRENLAAFCVEPRSEEYEAEIEGEPNHHYWTVLHEFPGGEDGYTIFYSEEDEMFGLAVTGANAKYCSIGFYGTFLEALSGM